MHPFFIIIITFMDALRSFLSGRRLAIIGILLAIPFVFLDRVVSELFLLTMERLMALLYLL